MWAGRICCTDVCRGGVDPCVASSRTGCKDGADVFTGGAHAAYMTPRSFRTSCAAICTPAYPGAGSAGATAQLGDREALSARAGKSGSARGGLWLAGGGCCMWCAGTRECGGGNTGWKTGDAARLTCEWACGMGGGCSAAMPAGRLADVRCDMGLCEVRMSRGGGSAASVGEAGSMGGSGGCMGGRVACGDGMVRCSVCVCVCVCVWLRGCGFRFTAKMGVRCCAV